MGYVGDPLRQTVTAWGFIITTFDKMRLKLSLGNKNLVNRRCGWHSLVSGSSLSSFFLLTYLDRIAGTGTHDNSAAL